MPAHKPALIPGCSLPAFPKHKATAMWPPAAENGGKLPKQQKVKRMPSQQAKQLVDVKESGLALGPQRVM